MNNSLDDKSIIKSFISHLKKSGFPDLTIDRWPDEENRDSADIDAIAGSLAIEHTSIDTLANQRRNSAWFMNAVGGIEKELSPTLTYRLNITMPYKGIQRGQSWGQIRDSMKAWIMNSSPTLLDGVHNIKNVSGIPFDFNVRKSSARKPGLFFSRYASEDTSLSSRIHDQLSRKARKLKPYNKQNYSTILLIESDDIALMNESNMIDAIKEAFSNSLPFGVDKLWYADTSIPDDILFNDFTGDIIAH